MGTLTQANFREQAARFNRAYHIYNREDRMILVYHAVAIYCKLALASNPKFNTYKFLKEVFPNTETCIEIVQSQIEEIDYV